MSAEDHATCTGCGQAVEREYEGEDRWVDEGTAGAGSLVFCTDQDETHDGVRHYVGPEVHHAWEWREREADRRLEAREGRPDRRASILIPTALVALLAHHSITLERDYPEIAQDLRVLAERANT